MEPFDQNICNMCRLFKQKINVLCYSCIPNTLSRHAVHAQNSLLCYTDARPGLQLEENIPSACVGLEIFTLGGLMSPV